MPDVKLSPVFQEMQFADDGSMLVGGKIYWYQAGTTTPTTVYTDSAGTSAHANPILLNARGEPPHPIYLPVGARYKAQLCDADGVPLRGAIDDIEGVNDVSQSDQFDGLMAANGWQELPGGFIWQWGYVTTNASGEADVTFPKPFPNALFRAIINPLADSAGYTVGGMNSSSTVGFNQNIINSNTFAIVGAGTVVGWYAVGN